MDNKSLVNMLVLNIGGTIGMVRNEDGALAPTSNIFFENIQKRHNMHDAEGYEKLSDDMKSPTTCLLPHVQGLNKQILYHIKEYDPLLDSSNVGSNEWIKIAGDIESNYNDYDAFVVLHGTDTLAYTSSVLSFVLENLSKTVVITGSQLSIFETRTDGITNFTNALTIAALGIIPEVCVVFDRKLMRGNRVAKISSVDLGAFDSPNAPVLGHIQVNAEINKSAILPMPKNAALKVHKELNSNIVLLRITPDMPIAMFKTLLAKPTEAAILQSFGSGNIPSNRQDILDELTAATRRGVIIINITQCLHGGVDAVYETGQVLNTCGVIPGYDMTEEATYAKLAYVLAQNWSVDEMKKKMMENIRGELTLPKQQ